MGMEYYQKETISNFTMINKENLQTYMYMFCDLVFETDVLNLPFCNEKISY